MEKRGLGHLEAILSFVIFIGFLIFAFFFFSPFSSNRTLDSTLTYAINELEDHAQVDVESYSVVLDESVSTGTDVGININYELENVKERVENSDGESIVSGISGTIIYFAVPVKKFVTVKLSEDYDSSDLTSVNILDSGLYHISSSDKTKFFSEKKFLELNESYYSAYNELKEGFNLPGRVDFAFEVVFDDGTRITSTKDVPEGLEVLSNQKRIEIIRKETGDKEFANLITKVW